MVVKVMLSRKVPSEKQAQLRALLVKMRSMSQAQPGYLSGETLAKVDDPEQLLVVSSWYSLEHWQEWLSSEERRTVQQAIDELLGEGTSYEVFYHL